VDKIRAGTDTNIELYRHPSRHWRAWTEWPQACHPSRSQLGVRMLLSIDTGCPFDHPSSRHSRRTADQCRQRPLLHRRQHS